MPFPSPTTTPPTSTEAIRRRRLWLCAVLLGASLGAVACAGPPREVTPVTAAGSLTSTSSAPTPSPVAGQMADTPPDTAAADTPGTTSTARSGASVTGATRAVGMRTAAARTFRAPVTAQQLAASDCDSHYSGCVPIASDVDCEGGDGNGPEYVAGPIRVLTADVYGLDRDGDGIACEPDAPRSGSAAPTTTRAPETSEKSERPEPSTTSRAPESTSEAPTSARTASTGSDDPSAEPGED